MAIKTFPTEAEAEAEAQTMAGWDTLVVAYTTLTGETAWVIQCDATTFLHDDGYVR